jgi:SAM-dependent methyltransferase
MRILEIGAGTGGTTQEILSSLINPSDGGKLWSSYTYTDISAGFFGAAKKAFKDYPALEFKTLDITKHPVSQGFDLHSYDLIIATNVIHAVPNLQEALRNVHTLLKPDGTFYLEELCCDVKYINFIMGLLPGWWLGEEDERADEPYVNPDRWDRELRAAGFSGLDDCMLDAPRPYQLQAYMISSPAIHEVAPKPVTLLFDDSSQQAVEDLQIELSQTGCFETVLHQWDTEADLPKGDIICLLDVSKPFFLEIEASRFETFRRLMAQISESGNGVLWLTRSSQLSCQDPRWGQTPGAMRTIRKEMEIDVAICEIDLLDNSSWKTVTQIARKFSRRHISSHGPELEYAIDHGRVYVPRLYPICVDEELRKAVTSSSTEEEVELDLTLGAVGRLDTLQWVTRSCQKPKDSQVAVEIMAAGLNFRVRLKYPDTC